MAETLGSTIEVGKARPSTITRIAVGVGGHPRDNDAVALANAIADVMSTPRPCWPSTSRSPRAPGRAWSVTSQSRALSSEWWSATIEIYWSSDPVAARLKARCASVSGLGNCSQRLGARSPSLHAGWEDAVMVAVESLRERALAATKDSPPTTEVRVVRAPPADTLVQWTRELDLLVIGSRRWGAPARVLFGGTGEALAHQARCPLLVTPRASRAEVRPAPRAAGGASSPTIHRVAEALPEYEVRSKGLNDRPVIVGVDGRGHDHDALALARTLHAAFGGRLVVAHVITPAPPGQGMVEAERRFRQDGLAMLGEAAAQLRRPAATELVEPDSPARGLAQLAEQHRAATVVLGSSHRGAVGRIAPGGVASHLITCTPCAIAIAPVGYAAKEKTPSGAVGVAYDGLAESDAALAAGAAAAVGLGVPLRLYHAMHEVPRDPAWAEFRGRMREFADGILKAGLTRLSAPVQATTVVLEGDVPRVLARAANEDDVGLLFVGSRGYGPVREALLHGVVGGLLHTARVPLVIVPSSADRES